LPKYCNFKGLADISCSQENIFKVKTMLQVLENIINFNIELKLKYKKYIY
jgi:hypothetical protein